MKKFVLYLVTALYVISLLAGCVPVLPNESTGSFTENNQTQKPTDAPQTEATVPESTGAESTVPQNTVPQTTVPETTVPVTTQPEATVPENTVPGTTVPEATVPENTVPGTTVPEATVPDPTNPEPTIPEPTVSEPTNPQPTVPQPTDPARKLVHNIIISGNSKVTVGNAIQLSAEVFPADADDKRVSWSIVSGSEFASISAGGFLTAKAVGKVTVRAMSMDGSEVTAAFYVTVTPVAVTGITISGPSEVTVGGTVQLTVAVTPDNAANKAVTWSVSSGSSYASVSADGVVTAKAAGKATIKATAKDGSGVTATYQITVAEPKQWDGSGTKSDPFLIRNLNDLLNLRNVLNKSGYYFKQVADIDVSSMDEWIVIGDEDKPFSHNYDGGGYVIRNITYGNKSGALFKWAKNCVFRNMHFENAVTKENFVTNPNDNSMYPGGGGHTGAIAGYAIGCSFYDCTATVDFRSSNSSTGGLAGFVVLLENQTDLMVNCHVKGFVCGVEGVGGLIGMIHKNYLGHEYSPDGAPIAVVKNCSSDAEILSKTGQYASAGGLIGEANCVRIEKCFATGNVTAKGYYIGGLVGHSQYCCEILRCYATGDIRCTSDSGYGGAFAGGLVGYMLSYAKVHDCYAAGDVYAPEVGWSDCQDNSSYDGGPWLNYRNPCGSLIGCVRAMGSDGKMEIYNCYATGKVIAPRICEDRVFCHGALIGCIYDDYTRKYIVDKAKKDQTDWAGYNDTSIANLGNNYNVEALRTYYTPQNYYEKRSGLPEKYIMPTYEYVQIITQAQLTDQSTFSGWDFQNVWTMGVNGPELR